MALDTREKRAAALGVGRPWMRDKLPGAVDEEWRIATGNAYGGNALSPPVGGGLSVRLIGPSGLIGEGGGLIR